MKLSIIIPAFDEEPTIAGVVAAVSKVAFVDAAVEIIVVDDGSRDGTACRAAEAIAALPNARLLRHEKNRGKGAAVRTGIEGAHGDYIVIQDADLEYDPADLPRLVAALDEKHRVVYGTRLARLPHPRGEEHTPQFMLHYLGNRLLSLIASALYGQWLTDMETGYKLFPREALAGGGLQSERFDLEPEITARLRRAGYRIKEVPITTKPRGYAAGKKLHTLRDGRAALWALLKYRFAR
jgi:dolichol-phosphate mannosyltransferase